MWRPLWKMLDARGRLRLPLGPARLSVTVGAAESTDARGGFDWQRYRTAESLYDAWGPAPGGRWEPYHCVPLFAALDALPSDKVGPTAPKDAERVEARPHLQGAARGESLGANWAREGVWIILDIPGIEAVTLAVRFAMAGYQPVCTFDHWPHPAGVLKPERILAQLLRYAPLMAEARQGLQPAAPPLWICDRERLGTRPGRPRQFDNRYYLDDSLLPGPGALREAGIEHIVCLVPEAADLPTEDLAAYFEGLRKEGFARIHGAAPADPDLGVFSFPEKGRAGRFSGLGYQRSAAGGFGRLIPEESSSSG